MKVDFPEEARSYITKELQTYFEDELEYDLGTLGADLLLDFIEKNIGRHFYNRGIEDAQQIIEMKMEDIKETLYATKS